MPRIFQRIDESAGTKASVLVTGESGVGKELVGRAVHLKSNRRDKAFVKLNCAAIPDTLMESELFGYEKGAFTGALTQKKGKLELANGGTLFLDKVGDLSLASQAKLLRFLAEGEFERVGGTQPSAWTSGSLPQRIRTWSRKSRASVSGTTCFTG